MRKSNTRQAAGSGNLRQRPNGTWEGRFSYIDPYGKPQRGSVYAPTQGECRKKLAAAVAEIDKTGTYSKLPKYTLEQWAEIWLKEYSAEWKPRTKDDYLRKLQDHILPYFGKTLLTNITPVSVQKWVNNLKGLNGQPLSAKSKKNLHGVLSSCLHQAVLSHVITYNPATNVKLPSVAKPTLKPLMDADLSRFMAAAQHHKLGNLFLIDLFTGLRQSEILGLQWRDIDFDNGEIHVVRQLQQKRDGGFIIVTPKNGKSRTVPFPPAVGALLKAERSQQAAYQLAAGELWLNKEGWVFTDASGMHRKHRTIQNDFRKLIASLGLQGTRFHDLRHSCAILALQSGCDIKSIQSLLGHYSSAFTMDVYADVSQKMMTDTQNRMEQAFQSALLG